MKKSNKVKENCSEFNGLLPFSGALGIAGVAFRILIDFLSSSEAVIFLQEIQFLAGAASCEVGNWADDQKHHEGDSHNAEDLLNIHYYDYASEVVFP